MSHVVVQDRGTGPSRCAYCHATSDEALVCADCGTLLHAECRALAGVCPTLGCASGGKTPARSERRPRRIAVGIVCLAAVVLSVVSSPAIHAVWRARDPSGYAWHHRFVVDTGDDPWGQAWCTTGPWGVTYSCGPNRLDEQRSGDDVEVHSFYVKHQHGAWFLWYGREVRLPLVAALAAATFAVLAGPRKRLGVATALLTSIVSGLLAFAWIEASGLPPSISDAFSHPLLMVVLALSVGGGLWAIDLRRPVAKS